MSLQTSAREAEGKNEKTASDGPKKSGRLGRCCCLASMSFLIFAILSEKKPANLLARSVDEECNGSEDGFDLCKSFFCDLMQFLLIF